MDTLQQQETQAFLEIIEALQAMEIKVAIAEQQLLYARERIAILEALVYGGPTK